MMRSLAVALVLLIATAGCRSLTGRSAGQWVDDRTTTARVKTGLARDAASTVTRVHVDTFNGVVYLMGSVDTGEEKRRAEAIAREVPAVQFVVNNLHVPDDAPAASPPTDRVVSRPNPVQARFPGIARLVPETGTPAWTRYTAQDRAGRRVATVYALHDAAQAVGDLPTDGQAVDHIGVYPAGTDTYLVLWHVDMDATAQLQ
jgi:hypothetical protein